MKCITTERQERSQRVKRESGKTFLRRGKERREEKEEEERKDVVITFFQYAESRTIVTKEILQPRLGCTDFS